ncbi:D-amino acid aminotransferase [Roseovarius sp. LXJ103]|uniref:D-amino acid aminotransferase n=1 Tax=Roseovarius carneus TaxID=2853164 RepID=UPI000D61C9AD|nr:D-amino acid aminotransferase [Roseovarius carneus]MBZ8117062.1 D-amino acid aminotransferase [Roseovarius carneus]PWE37088.1 D-amino acid aminotransferase [Pelagicola sp. LXJ1103]
MASPEQHDHLTRAVYLNGAFMPGGEAKLSIFDRGVLFADSVYEGLGILDGRITDLPKHLGRLKASLEKLSIPNPHSDEEYTKILQTLIETNDVAEGFLYLQITRGEADRDYIYPEGLKPNVFAFLQPHTKPLADSLPEGISMRSHVDLRWKRRDIKTTNLLGQVLVKVAGASHGADEALMIDDVGFITEGGSTSFFTIKDKIITARPVSNDILHGITRQTMLSVAGELGYEVRTSKIRLEDALAADEAFVSGSSTYLEPVVKIDGQVLGDGRPGPFTLRLRAAYLKAVRG